MPYLGETPAVGSRSSLNATTTVGTAAEEDTLIKFDGNAQDFHIGLDDSADDLVIGKGAALGTTTSMAFDEDGIVSMPLQPFAHTHLNGNQTIANVTSTKMLFTLEISDINGDFGSNKFTCPADGVYFIKAQVSGITADQKLIQNMININGTEHSRSAQMASGTSRLYGQVMGIVKADASDYIEVDCFQDSGGSLAMTGGSSPSYTHFMVIKIA